jgi:hypothetical protein
MPIHESSNKQITKQNHRICVIVEAGSVFCSRFSSIECKLVLISIKRDCLCEFVTCPSFKCVSCLVFCFLSSMFPPFLIVVIG